MRKPWQRICPNCHEVIEMYPLPKRIDWEPKLRPVIPCWRCGARLRSTKTQVAMQFLSIAIGAVVLFRWGPIWFAAGFVASLLLFVKWPLEVVERVR